MLAIAAHIPSSEIGAGYFQETHADQLFRECTHYCELVSNPRQMPRVLQTAVQHAVSKRGVSVLVLSGDVENGVHGRTRRRYGHGHGQLAGSRVMRSTIREISLERAR